MVFRQAAQASPRGLSEMQGIHPRPMNENLQFNPSPGNYIHIKIRKLCSNVFHGSRSCSGDEKGQGRAGASGLCGAPASHRGAWTDLGTTEPWPVRGPGTRAALKWLPASRLPEEGCSKSRTGCPPRLPCRQGASASQQQARRGQGAPLQVQANPACICLGERV